MSQSTMYSLLVAGLGAGTALSVAYREQLASLIRRCTGIEPPKFLTSRGSDPIDIFHVSVQKDPDPPQRLSNEPLLPIWDQAYQTSGHPSQGVWPIYPPSFTQPTDPNYHWNHHTNRYEYQPRSVLTQHDRAQSEDISSRMYANTNLAELMFDAGKFYFSKNAQITGLTVFKDVMAVCDYPHRFYNDIRQCFNSQGASHLSRLLEADAEIQAILKAKRDPDIVEREADVRNPQPDNNIGSYRSSHRNQKSTDTRNKDKLIINRLPTAPAVPERLSQTEDEYEIPSNEIDNESERQADKDNNRDSIPRLEGQDWVDEEPIYVEPVFPPEEQC